MRFAIDFLSSTAGKAPPWTGTSNGLDLSEPAPAVIFNPRMRSRELVARMLCAAAGLDARTIWTKPVSLAEIPRLAKAAGQLSCIPILIGETGFGIS